MNGADALVTALRAHGIEWISTLCGHGLNEVYAACQRAGLRLVDVRNEQTAAYAADALGRLSGGVGVCAVSSGVAHANALTGVVNAHFDGAPMLLLTGAGPLATAGKGHFQDFDQVALARPVCKYARVLDRADRVPERVHEAMAAALGGRPGPVHLTFPLDVQTATVADDLPVSPAAAHDRAAAPSAAADYRSRLPGGTAPGRGRHRDPRRRRQRSPAPHGPGGPVDPGRPAGLRRGLGRGLRGGADQRLRGLAGAGAGSQGGVHGAGAGHARRRRPARRRSPDGWRCATPWPRCSPTRRCSSSTAATWPVAHQTLGRERYPGTWLTCGASGVVGYGIGAAMAAKAGFPRRPVVLLSGDGSATFNLTDLESAARQGLPFVMVVADDEAWGITVSGHRQRYGAAMSSELGAVDFAAAATAFGALGVTAGDAAHLRLALGRALSDTRPVLVHARIAGGGPGEAS